MYLGRFINIVGKKYFQNFPTFMYVSVPNKMKLNSDIDKQEKQTKLSFVVYKIVVGHRTVIKLGICELEPVHNVL